jgi:hypothetical protein
MNSRRFWAPLAIVAACTMGTALAGCAAETDDGVAEQEAALAADARAAGIAEGSLDEEGVLLLANDRAASMQTLRDRARVPEAVARAIATFRDGDASGPRWFETLDELDALPGTDAAVFRNLAADARANGYVEAPGFDEPLVALKIPEGLGRRPTANDVIVEAGFDKKTPDEVVTIVRGRLRNAVHRQNEAFTRTTILETHKAFTLAINNLWASGSPHAIFAFRLQADQLVVLGTVSALTPIYLMAVKNGVTTYYRRGDAGTYEETPKPTYPILMRAKVRLGGRDPAGMPTGWGVRVFYPSWKATVLSKARQVTITYGH